MKDRKTIRRSDEEKARLSEAGVLLAEKLKTSRWQSPVGDFGGINRLVWQHFHDTGYKVFNPVLGETFFTKIILHSYREKGYTLEVNVEVHSINTKTGEKTAKLCRTIIE